MASPKAKSPDSSSMGHEIATANMNVSHETVRAWRLFSPILLTHLQRVPVGLYWFRWQEEKPNIDHLRTYIRLGTSPRVDFITHLAIHKAGMFRTSDLMALADMPNLGILEISNLRRTTVAGAEDTDIESSLSDRLVRGWSEKDKPFPSLRVLVIASNHQSLTLQALQYVARFPSLVFCILQSDSLPNKHEAICDARIKGWRMEDTLKPWRESKLGKGIDYDFWTHYPSERQPDKVKEIQLSLFDQVKRGGVHLSPYHAATSDSQKDKNQLEAAASHPGDMDKPLERYIRRHHFQHTLSWIMWNLYSALGEQIGNADLLSQGVELRKRATHMAPTNWWAGHRPRKHTYIDDNGEEQRSPDLWARERWAELQAEQQPDPWNRVELLPPKQMLSVMLNSPTMDYPGHYHRDPVLYGGDENRGRNEEMFRSVTRYTFVRDYSPTMATPPRNTGTDGEGKSSTQSAGGGGVAAKRKENTRGSTFRPRKRRDMDDLLSYGMGGQSGS